MPFLGLALLTAASTQRSMAVGCMALRVSRDRTWKVREALAQESHVVGKVRVPPWEVAHTDSWGI